jgi:hypothetical protein
MNLIYNIYKPQKLLYSYNPYNEFRFSSYKGLNGFRPNSTTMSQAKCMSSIGLKTCQPIKRATSVTQRTQPYLPVIRSERKLFKISVPFLHNSADSILDPDRDRIIAATTLYGTSKEFLLMFHKPTIICG